MSEKTPEIQKNQDETPIIPENSVENILQEAGREVVLKFGFVEYLPDIAPSLFEGGKGTRLYEMLVAHLGQYEQGGLLDNASDVMDAVRVFYAETIAVQVSDMMYKQAQRLRKELVGTWDGKDTFRLNKVIDAIAKINRSVVEIKSSSGFSRVARKEIGVGGQSELERVLAEIQKSVEGGAQAVDMADWLIQRPAVRKELSGQSSLLDVEDARVVSDETGLTSDELRELADSR